MHIYTCTRVVVLYTFSVTHTHFPQTIVLQLGEGDMDSIVMAVGQKKTLVKMWKEYEDLVSCGVCVCVYVGRCVGVVGGLFCTLVTTHTVLQQLILQH